MGGKHGDSTVDDNPTLTRDTKIVLMVIITVMGIFGVLSPRLFNIYGRKISYANLCSSGVLFSAGLVHLLGEAVETVNDAFPGNFGWGYLLCALSFYFIFVTERFMELGMNYIEKKRREKEGKPAEECCGHCQIDDMPKSQDFKAINSSSNLNRSAEALVSMSPVTTPTAEQKVELPSSSPPVVVLELNSFKITKIEKKPAELDDHHHGGEIASLFQKQNYMAAFALMFGLGLHSTMAGFALGASKSSATVLSLGIAIIAHKYLEAFSLGCPLYKARMSIRKHAGVAVFFALLTPFGMAIGWGFGNQLAGYIGDVFVCLTAGTFLYISIVEIMIPEFSHHHHDLSHSESEHGDIHDEDEHSNPVKYELYKMGSIAFGFTLMTIASVWA